MAVGSAPISFVNDVQASFTTNTPTPSSLIAALDALFDPYNNGRTEDSLLDFENSGEPNTPRDPDLDVWGATTADFTCNVASPGKTGIVASLRMECNTGSLYQNTPIYSPIATFDTVDALRDIPVTVSGLDQGTDYYYRMQYWNGYNEGNRSHHVGSSNSFTTTIQRPRNLSNSQSSSGILLEWDHPTAGVPPLGYRIEVSVNSGIWQFVTNTSSTSYLHDGCGTDWNNFDSVQHRIKSRGNDIDSIWNNFASINAFC